MSAKSCCTSGSAISPALDGPRLAREFDLTLAERSLDDVVRQELDSGILANAHALRQDIGLAKDLPEDVKAPLPQFSTEAYPDLHIVTGNDLAELLDDLHHRHGDQDVVIITRSNKRANDFNEQIRRRILWREEELDAGDRLMLARRTSSVIERSRAAAPSASPPARACASAAAASPPPPASAPPCSPGPVSCLLSVVFKPPWF